MPFRYGNRQKWNFSLSAYLVKLLLISPSRASPMRAIFVLFDSLNRTGMGCYGPSPITPVAAPGRARQRGYGRPRPRPRSSSSSSSSSSSGSSNSSGSGSSTVVVGAGVAGAGGAGAGAGAAGAGADRCGAGAGAGGAGLGCASRSFAAGPRPRGAGAGSALKVVLGGAAGRCAAGRSAAGRCAAGPSDVWSVSSAAANRDASGAEGGPGAPAAGTGAGASAGVRAVVRGRCGARERRASTRPGVASGPPTVPSPAPLTLSGAARDSLPACGRSMRLAPAAMANGETASTTRAVRREPATGLRADIPARSRRRNISRIGSPAAHIASPARRRARRDFDTSFHQERLTWPRG